MRLETLPFAGHNVVLPDGTQTKPGTPLIGGNGITLAALRVMRLACPPGATVADLGCLEGGYSAAFAEAGYDVLGVESRAANVARCRWLAAQLGSSARFAHDDVRHLPDYGEFDVTFCAGLLYHLDKPCEFLQMLGRVTRRLLIVQSHYSLHPDAEHEGRAGHWYNDNPGDGDPFGSHGNPRSFWLAEGELLAAVRDAGFAVVFRQYDYLDDIAGGPIGIPGPGNPCGGDDRGMFIGVKP
jgi:SAM-dependent methyltransferase